MKKIFFLTTFLTAISLVFFTSCPKNETKTDGKAKLAVYLTDDPGDYDEVNVDIQDVQINFTTDSAGGWQSLPGVAKGVYNLLDFVDNNDTLLVNADIPAGKIQQIRLVLGNDNTIVVDGVESVDISYPSFIQDMKKIGANFSQS